MQSALTNVLKCANCGRTITQFTGSHIMTKAKKTQQVCGMCAAELEIDGWRAKK